MFGEKRWTQNSQARAGPALRTPVLRGGLRSAAQDHQATDTRAAAEGTTEELQMPEKSGARQPLVRSRQSPILTRPATQTQSPTGEG